MWFIGVEVEQEMSAPHPKKNPESASAHAYALVKTRFIGGDSYWETFGPLSETEV